MSAFAIYRLPYADHCIRVEQTDGEPAEFLSCTELNGRNGFVVAPFDITPEQPILLIRPDTVENVEFRPERIEYKNSQLSTLNKIPMPSTSPIIMPNLRQDCSVRLCWHVVSMKRLPCLSSQWHSSNVPVNAIPVCLSHWSIQRRVAGG